MFKKRKNKSIINPESPTNFPHRPGRKVIGLDQPPAALLKEDKTTRRLDDFRRPDGYHPTQPLVTGKILGENQTRQVPSMLNTTLSGDLSSPKSRDKPQKEKTSIRVKLKRVSLLMGVVLLTGIGWLALKGLSNLEKVFGSNSGTIQTVSAPSALHTEGDGRINILLLGIGGAGHDGPDLTDTMLLVSIDTLNHTAGLVSIPRDLWINFPGFSQTKANTVYESGKWAYLGSQSDSNQNQKAVQAGFNADNNIIGKILGIPIQYDGLVNFTAFQEAVDTLGGINVNVPTELYDPTIAWENNNNPVIAKVGEQKFNGAQALLYVRSRETTSDFARTQRQRQVMLAIKDKVLSAGTFSNPIKLAQLSDEFGNNVVTNLSLSDIKTLYGVMSSTGDSGITSIGLGQAPNNYVTTSSINGQSVVVPTAGLNDYSSIQYYIRNTLKDSYLAKENAGISILNGTTNSSAATNEAKILKSYGYNVINVGDAPTKDYKNTQLVDLTNGADKYTLNYLQRRLGVKAVRTIADSSIQPGSANFVIILGQG